MLTIPHSRPTLGKEESAAVLAVLRSGQIAQGGRVADFEKALAAQVGVGNAAAVSSGTAALQMALLALGAGEGDEVVIPSFVCPALLHAVRAIRAVPVLADIDRETFNTDIRDLRRRLTRKTKAVIVPHLFGLPAEIAPIVALGIPVVEDCAQALGSRYDGAPAGSFGVLSVFSFYATKVICTGEGGMVAGRDSRLIEKIRDLREYDEKEDNRPRFNLKMTDLQAALGLAQLRRLPALIARRREIAERYDASLRGLSVSLPARPPRSEPIHYRYVIRTRQAAELLASGPGAGIAYRRPVFKPLHRYLGLTGYPETEAAFAECVSLPIYPSLRGTEVNTILRHLRSILR